MILYQLAQGIQERAQLKAKITATEGDTQSLVHKMEQVGERIMHQTSQWMDHSMPGMEPDETDN